MVANDSSLDRFLLQAERQLLFHGGGIPGVRVFRPAENETFGNGFYLTSDRERGESYAVFRAKTEYGGECDAKDIPTEGFQPTCYVFEADGLQFLDLRTEEAMRAVVPFWREYISKNRMQIVESARRYFNPEYREIMVAAVLSDRERVLRWDDTRLINRYAFLQPQSYLNTVLSQWLQGNDYDGLIAIEGNDKNGKHETKKGDTWVVFDSRVLEFIQEYKIKNSGEKSV